MTKRNLRSKASTLGKDAEQLYEKRIQDLESVNEALKCDVEELRSKLADVSVCSSTQQSSREFSHKSNVTKEEAMSSRSRSNFHSMCSTKMHKSASPAKLLDGEVQKLKAQKVKLQCKIKLDSMHFRLLKSSLEKEILQLKKELRKSEFENHVFSALNRRQKMILQLKNTQALTALKRLKLLLQSKKISSNKNNGPPKGSKIQESSDECRLLMKLNKIHSDYECQMKKIAEEVKRFSVEADVLKAEFEEGQNSGSLSCDNPINHTPMDSELKELKEEFNKLSTLVSQREMTKPQLCENDEVQVEPAEHSFSSKKTNMESLQPKTAEEIVYKPVGDCVSSKSTKDQSNLELSRPKTCEEPVCQREQSKAEMCCSCTKKSLCKTKSCKCRANGNGCGNSCGCLASKCSNREENVKSNKPMQPVVGKKLAGVSYNDKYTMKQPLHDVVNINEAGKVGKMKK